MAKRKVFISYHHKGEQKVVDDFIKEFSDDYDVFTDESLERAADSEDAEYLNQVCRDAIDGTSVTIVIIGKQTGCRKFVDWEIRHTLYREHGLVGISRPSLADSDACLPKRLIDNRNSGYTKWYKYPTSAASLKNMIDEAYSADTKKIDNSREKMKRNTSC
ncbi:MAG: TIR domain-containing protein [Gammaproteobacteria bacterium]|nr:MAG: TIR domain-containing protein [Gammaproteobacteria bacterium]